MKKELTSMFRICFVLTIAAIMLIPGSSSILQEPTINAATAHHIRLSMTSADMSRQMTIIWETDTNDNPNQVEYGLTAACELGTVTGFQYPDAWGVDYQHEVTLTGLTPDTDYFYRCSNDNSAVGWSIVNNFTTAPDHTTDFVWLTAGDSRTYYDDWAIIANAMDAHPEARLVYFHGDVLEDFSTEAEWTEWMGPAEQLIADVPFVSNTGNHEIPYQNFWDCFSWPGNERWFSFNYSMAHFIILDTEATTDANQRDWLENDLIYASTDEAHPWIFVSHHIPAYCSGGLHLPDSDVQTQWVPLFEQYGVDLVMSGHNHYYERTASLDATGSVSNPSVHMWGPNYTDPQHPIYMVIGRTGAPAYSSNNNSGYVQSWSNALHYTKMSMYTDGRLHIETFDETNTKFDDAWIIKTDIIIKPDQPVNPIPADDSLDIGLNPTLSVDVYHMDGATPMDIHFYDASGPTLIGTDTDVPSGGTATMPWNGLAESTDYNWYAVADDSSYTTQSLTWTFRTTDTIPPASPTSLTVEHWGTVSDHVVISEINMMDAPEWVELYNPTDQPVDLTGWTLDGRYENDATIGSVSIQPYSYYSIGDAGSGADLEETITLTNSASANCWVRIQNSGSVTIDAVGWDPLVILEGEHYETAMAANPGTTNTLERKSTEIHDEAKGNGWDTNDNSQDFIVRTTPQIQTAASPPEQGPVQNGDNILNWTLSADDGSGANDVDYYEIYRSDSSSGPWDIAHLLDTVPAGINSYVDPEKGLPDGIIWWYVVRAVDTSSNGDSNSNSVPEPGAAPLAYEINLSGHSAEDWAFVSFPIVIAGNIETILNDSINGDGLTNWDVAKWYDPQDAADPWKTYRFGASTNDLLTINNTMGVWIHLTENGGDLNLTTGATGEYSATFVNVNLYTGWNLVSYPSNTSKTAFNALSGINADWISVYDPVAPFVRDESDLNTVIMNQGNAYWVHVTEDSIWQVDA